MTASTNARRLAAGLLICLSALLLALAQPPSGSAAAGNRHGVKRVKPLFAPDSIWNKPLRSGAALDPSSRRRSAAFIDEIHREIADGTGPWIDESSYSTPIYTVGRNQRTVPVQLDTGSWGDSLQAIFDEGVPIPAKAQAAAGTDGHLAIYQPSTDRLWEMWKASRQADGWHASWGGAMQHVSRSPGYYSGSSWPGLSKGDGWNWGSTASSLPIAGGVITIADLESGSIDHALALNIPAPCEGVFAWPAQRTDGTSGASDCLPEGAHLRIDPRLDLKKLGLPPVSLMIARAAQKYGLIIRDQTGHATGLYAEDPTRTGSDPYYGRRGFYDGLDPWEFLPQLPWDHVELLRMNTCRQAPCSLPG